MNAAPARERRSLFFQIITTEISEDGNTAKHPRARRTQSPRLGNPHWRDGETAAAQLAPTWPSLEAMTHVLHRHTSLGISSDFAMGEQYARTLREWRAGFLAATDDIGQLGFGRAFQRMRDLYLAYSEAGFRSG